MTTVPQVESAMHEILTQRANALAKETGAIQRQRKLTGANLRHMLVFGWMQHPNASLETLCSTAAMSEVYVSDTAVNQRFTPKCADFLHAVLEALLAVVVQAEEVEAPKVLRRFSAVVLEDSSTITLPAELAELWRGCGGNQTHTSAAVKLHVRLRTQVGTVVGSRADRWTPIRSSQPFGPRGVTRRQFVCQRSGRLLAGRDRPAQSAPPLYADAPASRHSPL